MVRSFHDNDTHPWPAIHPGSQSWPPRPVRLERAEGAKGWRQATGSKEEKLEAWIPEGRGGVGRIKGSPGVEGMKDLDPWSWKGDTV